MTTRKLTYLSLFVALGILLPQIFHMIGGQGMGSVFLPMHIPTIIGAMLLGPISGAIIGIISVLVGAALGMPPMPMAIFMLFEISTYGLVAGYLYNKRKLNVYIGLIGAMVAGRAVSLIAMRIALQLFGVKLPPIFGTIALFAPGIPGIIIHILLIPPLVLVLRRVSKWQ